MENDQFKYLLELLDDDNEQSASLAMAELLKSDEASLDHCLRSLQTSDNPRLRSRLRQLESARRQRRKRMRMESRINRPAAPLLETCVQLHLEWFDRDTAENVMKQWNELLSAFRSKYMQRPSLRDTAEFLSEAGFQAPLNDDLAADFFCIGTVLEEKYGADVLLCVIAASLLRACGSDAAIIRRGDDYGVMDAAGNLLYPGPDWEYKAKRPFARRAEDVAVLTDAQVIRFAASMLFLCAVGCDSFRYIYTVGGMLSAMTGSEDGTAFLPYPYNSTTQKS